MNLCALMRKVYAVSGGGIVVGPSTANAAGHGPCTDQSTHHHDALEEEAARHDEEMAAVVDQFNREKPRIMKNYQQLCAKCQEIRSPGRSVCSLLPSVS